MKYGILITSYSDFDLLLKVVEKYSKYANIYIHIDKRAVVENAVLEKIKSVGNTKIIRTHKVYWGSYKHILAILDLLRLAYEDGCDYFSIVSENTIPVVPSDKIYDYFSNNRNIYMEVKERGENSYSFEFEDRYKAYYFQDLYNHKSKYKLLRGAAKCIEKISVKIQRKIKLRENVEFKYKGYVYCHFDRDAAEVVFAKMESEPKYIDEIKRCYVGEEFFFQNIFMNSDLSEIVVNDSLIYDDWNKGTPAILEMEDIPAIDESGKLFARKFKSETNVIKYYI